MTRTIAALALALVACSSDGGDGVTSTTATTTGAGGAGTGGGGPGGSGGDGSTVGVTTSGAGGEGGAGGEASGPATTTTTTAATGTGAGGEGGQGGEAPWEPPCEPAECEPFGLYCDDCMGFEHSCDDEVCNDVGRPEPMLIAGKLLGGFALRVPRIDPGTMHPTCEAVCGGGAAWAVRLALPDASGCWTVDAPPGWYAATRPAVGGDPPRACPVDTANTDECVRGTYAEGDHLIIWLRDGEGSQAANIWINVTTEPCPAEPVDCGPSTCNGEEP